MRAQLAGAIEFIHAPSVLSPAALRPAFRFAISRWISSWPLYLIGPLTSGLWLVMNCSGKPQSGCGLPEQFMTNHSPLVNGPIKYKGQELIQRDIANLKAGLKAAGLSTEGAWMNSIAPASCARMANEYYKSEEEQLYACADAMHEEYKAIVDAGLTVQLDDPAIGE